MPIVRVNDIDLYYQTAGAGETLVLIAGFACDHTIWELMLPAFTPHYRVVTFDNRGVGQTSAPHAPYSVRQMADDTAGLLAALGPGPVHVVGHSMGGMIAQELALNYPDRVRSLMLLATRAQGDARERAIIEMWGRLPRLIDPADGVRLVLPWLYTNAFFAPPGAEQAAVDQILSNPHPPTPHGVYRQSQAINACDTADRLGDIRCPTLVLVGREDILLPVACSQALAEGIPGAELVVLDGTAHNFVVETPDAVAAALLVFLVRHAAK
jgi:pimeloyl-ACP methyl ester carboxylesterase